MVLALCAVNYFILLVVVVRFDSNNVEGTGDLKATSATCSLVTATSGLSWEEAIA